MKFELFKQWLKAVIEVNKNEDDETDQMVMRYCAYRTAMDLHSTMDIRDFTDAILDGTLPRITNYKELDEYLNEWLVMVNENEDPDQILKAMEGDIKSFFGKEF